MKAIVTLIDDNGNVIEKDLTFEPVRTEKIYEPAIMSYRLFEDFRFTYNRIVPREYIDKEN